LGAFTGKEKPATAEELPLKLSIGPSLGASQTLQPCGRMITMYDVFVFMIYSLKSLMMHVLSK